MKVGARWGGGCERNVQRGMLNVQRGMLNVQRGTLNVQFPQAISGEDELRRASSLPQYREYLP